MPPRVYIRGRLESGVDLGLESTHIIFTKQRRGLDSAHSSLPLPLLLSLTDCWVPRRGQLPGTQRRNTSPHAMAGAVSNPEVFSYGVEAYEACKKRCLTSDILEEQKKVQEADLVIFQFPLYWFSVPAIMKGWMDRVLCQGFAFDFPGIYDAGFLKGKLALLSLTTGGTAEMYTRTGASGDFRYFLWPLQHGALHFCGFQVLAPQISFAPEYASEEERKAMVASWAQRLKTIWQEKPIQCTPPWYFGH
uniref:Ribosyldihydronicotinamide dehydrogenase [quinone] n=1 Tax=Oryctolagus cuniculus TaxID=9986 RepID=A0A5F9DT87_RABIT